MLVSLKTLTPGTPRNSRKTNASTEGLEGDELHRKLLEAVNYSVTVQSELRDNVSDLNNTVKDLRTSIGSLANRNYNELQNHANQLKIMVSL